MVDAAAAPPYSPAELAARGEAPIKREYVRAGAPPPPAPPAAGAAAAPAAPLLQPKSKAAARRDRAAAKSVQLCHNFAAGRCGAAAAECRFSHDVAAFLATKPADLPGRCPFSAAERCPYGPACRWAGTHRGEGGADGAAPAEEEEADEQPAAPPAAGEAAAPLPGDAWWRHDGSIPAALPVRPAARVQPSLNALQREPLQRLRKKAYDYSRADAALAALGIRNTAAERDAKPAPAAKRQRVDGDAGFVCGVGEPAAGAGAAAGPAGAAAPRPPAAAPADYVEARPHARERPALDLRGKTFLAPLTTVGNLPFRRLCKSLGADVTCGEMALATNLLQGHPSEWALLKRHPEEDLFGVQLCGGYGDAVARAAQLVTDTCAVDFVDLNFGCPIDVVCGRGAGASCLQSPRRLESVVRAAAAVLPVPLTLKLRRGYADGADVAHDIAAAAAGWGAAAVTVHGRSREARYSRPADWGYIGRCAAAAAAAGGGLQVVGNGDVLGWEDHAAALARGVATTYVARGALLKPWVFTEIRERRHWDISARERLDLYARFVRHGLEHWGADARGVEATRRFLLEWLSFAHRYVPVGLLDALPQGMGWRAPRFVGRSDLETLLASPDPADWVRISGMLLGPPPPGFSFTPKHKASAQPAGARGGGSGGQENG